MGSGCFLFSLCLSLCLILGPSSASHPCSEDGGFLSISGSQLTHEDVTQNLPHTHVQGSVQRHPWLWRNSLLFKISLPSTDLFTFATGDRTGVCRAGWGSDSCWRDATINTFLLRASPTAHQISALGSSSSQGSSAPCSQHHLPLSPSLRRHPVLPARPALIHPPV